MFALMLVSNKIQSSITFPFLSCEMKEEKNPFPHLRCLWVSKDVKLMTGNQLSSILPDRQKHPCRFICPISTGTFVLYKQYEAESLKFLLPSRSKVLLSMEDVDSSTA
jgi:hypothetical protein